MPPTRSLPPRRPSRFVAVQMWICLPLLVLTPHQTERTHEENQERAYIAASRRSDRSLEARVESAKRASEIHKRRTGRSLRVTEQDVQNEEMYEEEDDDLPLQYRRLTAHLQTGSPDFNKRLAAYLTHHVAMRSALEQSIHDSYAQSFPNAPQYSHQSMYPSPMLAHQQQQQQLQQHQQMMQPPQSPSMYRQAPYPQPRPQQGFTTAHQRSASIAVPQDSSSNSATSPYLQPERRASMPPAPGSLPSPADSRTPGTPQGKPSFPPGSFSSTQMPQQNNTFTGLPPYDMGAFGSSVLPAFSTQLPAESQGFLGSTLNHNDPLTSMMMAGSSNLPSSQYDFSSTPQQNNLQTSSSTMNVGKQQSYPTFDGLNSTLAPSVLEQPTFKSDVTSDSGEDFFNSAMAGKDSASGTPGLNGDSWADWINDQQWDIPPTASQ